MKILLDTNVVLDLLLERSPFVAQAKNIFEMVEAGKIEGYLCATTLTTIYYLVSKQVIPQKDTPFTAGTLNL